MDRIRLHQWIHLQEHLIDERRTEGVSREELHTYVKHVILEIPEAYRDEARVELLCYLRQFCESTIAFEGRGQLYRLVGNTGGYRLLTLITKTRLSLIWLAERDVTPGTTGRVVVKIMKDDACLSARFMREIEIIESLNYQGIVTLIDSGHANNVPFYVTHYFSGGDLGARMDNITAPEAARIAHKIATAVAYLHSRDIIHRDIKPGNILLDDNGNPHINDFGLAFRGRQDNCALQTRADAVIGTPLYMPPEQFESSRVGKSADVYSIGLVLYQMLTKILPFSGDEDEIRHQKVLHSITPIRKINKDVDKKLEYICLQCISKRPEDRYVDARELAEALDAYFDNKPIKFTRTPIFWTLAWRTLALPRVYPQLSIAIIVVALLIALGTGLGFYGYSQHTRAEIEVATAKSIAEQARRIKDSEPERSLLLASAAAERAIGTNENLDVSIVQALFDCVANSGGTKLPGYNRIITTINELVVWNPDEGIICLDHDYLVRKRQKPLNLGLMELSGGVVSKSRKWLAGWSADSIWLCEMQQTGRWTKIADNSLDRDPFGSSVPTVKLIGFSQDERWLVTRNGHHIHLAELVTANSDKPLTITIEGDEFTDDAVIAGDVIIVAGRELRLWKLSTIDKDREATVLGTFPGHWISRLAVSGNGHWLAVGLSEGPWAFPPTNEDSRAVGRVESPEAVRVWNVWNVSNGISGATIPRLVNGSEIVTDEWDPFDSHNGRRIIFDANGKWLAFGNDLCQLTYKKDYVKLRTLAEVDIHHNVVFSDDGRWLVAYPGVWVWDLQGPSDEAPLQIANGPVADVKMCPASRYLSVRVPDSNKVLVWDLLECRGDNRPGDESTTPRWSRLPPSILQGHDTEVAKMEWHSSGRYLLTEDSNKSVRLWQFGTYDVSLAGTVVSRSPDVHARISEDRDVLITFPTRSYGDTSGQAIKLWDLTTDNPTRAPICSCLVTSVEKFDVCRRWAAAMTNDHNIEVWDLTSGGSCRTMSIGHEPQFVRVANNRVFVGYYVQETVAEIALIDLDNNTRRIVGRIVEDKGDIEARAYAMENGGGAMPRPFMNVALSSNGERLAITQEKGRLVSSSFVESSYVHYLWEVDDQFTSPAAFDKVEQLWGFTTDGRYLVGTRSGALIVWDCRAESLENPLVLNPTFSEDAFICPTISGHHLAVSDKEAIYVWDIENGATRTWRSPYGAVGDIQLVSDGRRILTTCQDDELGRHVILWEMANDTPTPIVFSGRLADKTYNGPVVSGNGRWLLNGDELWPMDIRDMIVRARAIAGRDMTEGEMAINK